MNISICTFLYAHFLRVLDPHWDKKMMSNIDVDSRLAAAASTALFSRLVDLVASDHLDASLFLSPADDPMRESLMSSA